MIAGACVPALHILKYPKTPQDRESRRLTNADRRQGHHLTKWSDWVRGVLTGLACVLFIMQSRKVEYTPRATIDFGE